MARESLEISTHIDRVTKLPTLRSNCTVGMLINGHARNEEDEKDIKTFFFSHLPKDLQFVNAFYEKLYLYQSYCWYAFIRQDFLMYYRYSQRWVDIFEAEPNMKSIETGHYIKGLHNLLNAHFDLRNFEKFEATIAAFEAFAQTPEANHHDNFRTHTSILYQ